MSVLLFITLAAGMALAADKKAAKVYTLSGEVLRVDAQAATIVIKYHKKEVTFKGEPKLLEGITVGEKVRVEHKGDTLISIQEVKVKAKAPAKKS